MGKMAIRNKSNQNGCAQNQRFEIVEPRADALIESLRAVGYSLATAIADLIDNSISAGAKTVRLDCHWDGNDSYITLADDGIGMSEKDLITAMRPGSRSPLENREADDLGRFGLGLKTASFSQCRRLTVRSRTHSGRTATRCWDLDYVKETREWRLLHNVAPSTEERMSPFKSQKQGTIVLWECLDRLIGEAETDDQDAHHRFLEMIEEVESHLGMVFNRFMTGSKPLKIFVNGTRESNRVHPWNPFLDSHPATQQLAPETIVYKHCAVSVQSFVLPHHDKLGSELYDRAGGPKGWIAQQGFYVYRNKRLLVAGSWLGFPYTQEEHYKLARIQIDIPGSTDNDWNIDVKKSVARPPAPVRKQLRRIADITRKRAVDIYRHRGKLDARHAAKPHVFAWKTIARGGKTFYAIDREHPLVKSVLDMPKERSDVVRALLRLLEETVPIQTIWLDEVNAPGSHGQPFEQAPEKDVLQVLRQVLDALIKGGLSGAESKKHLQAMEAFSDYQHLIASLTE
jgi:hypothetical protein